MWQEATWLRRKELGGRNAWYVPHRQTCNFSGKDQSQMTQIQQQVHRISCGPSTICCLLKTGRQGSEPGELLVLSHTGWPSHTSNPDQSDRNVLLTVIGLYKDHNAVLATITRSLVDDKQSCVEVK